MERKLIFMDANSSKFWNIVLEGNSHTVNYGRTGTDGQTKTKEFDDAQKAQASFEKLVKQKIGKGYVDAGGAGAEAGAHLPAVAFHSVLKQDDLYNNIKTFAGKKVADYDPEKKPTAGGKTIYRFRSDWEEDQQEENLIHFLESDAAAEATGIVIGQWGGEDPSDASPATLIEALVKHKAQLPKLNALYIGDIVQEENEMSWIGQADVSPLLKAFPGLELLRTRGAMNLSIAKANHKKLRALAIETGGLDVSIIRSICTGKLPELEHLELWLGTDQYGGNSSVKDLQQILSGKLFPKLKYLGLRNCDYVDDIAGVIVNSPIIERIETLDLSLGTLTDTGGEALLGLPTGGSLKKVNLHHHFMTAAVSKKLKALKLTVDVSGANDAEDDWRFVAVGE